MSTGKDKPATSESREWTLYRCPECGWWEGDANLARDPAPMCNGADWHGLLHRPAPMTPLAVVPREEAEGLVFLLGMVALRAAEREPRWCAEMAQRAVDAFRVKHPEPEGTK